MTIYGYSNVTTDSYVLNLPCLSPIHLLSSSLCAVSFSSLGFVALYIAGKLQVFNQGRGRGWRFVSFIAPLIWALMIAVSRTSDYHHHWQGRIQYQTPWFIHHYFTNLLVTWSCLRHISDIICKVQTDFGFQGVQLHTICFFIARQNLLKIK